MENKSLDEFIKKILKDCQRRKIPVESKDFVAFLVSLVSVSSSYEGEEESSNQKKIHAAVIEKLLDHSGPSLLTLKIQFYFSKHYCGRESVIDKHRARLVNKTVPLIREICEMNQLGDTRDIQVLYQKMLVVATVLSGMGDPRVPVVLREVAIALQSVLQPSELPRYVALSRREKEEQLMELVFIVAGIRLFNRDCQRGGEGIDDQVPSILQAGVNRTHSSIIHLLELLMDRVYKFTAIVESATFNRSFRESIRDSKEMLWCVEMLVTCRQQEIYVRKLLADLQICDEKIRSLICCLKNIFFQLHETLKYRTAVPTEQVYPQFKYVAELWLKLQDEVIALSYINELLWEMQYFFPKSVDRTRLMLFNKMLRKVTVLTDAQRLDRTMGKLIAECGDCPLAYPSCDTNFDKMNIQFLGFCAWSFVVGNGALIPGNPNIGVAQWNGKYFAFSSIEAARQFGENPDKYINTALDIVKKRQEYVHLFQIFKEIQTMDRGEKSSGEYFPFAINQSQGVQTELHVFPSYIDMNYSPNLWVHRQRVLQYANIYQCLTRSTQTAKSHFRTGVCLQTLMPKEKAVQTLKESSTSTKKSNKHIFGLRSRDNNVQFIDYSFNK